MLSDGEIVILVLMAINIFIMIAMFFIEYYKEGRK